MNARVRNHEVNYIVKYSFLSQIKDEKSDSSQLFKIDGQFLMNSVA